MRVLSNLVCQLSVDQMCYSSLKANVHTYNIVQPDGLKFRALVQHLIQTSTFTCM